MLVAEKKPVLTYKYRIYPTKAQIDVLNGFIDEARHLYNDALQERNDAWKTCHKSISYYNQCAELKPLRAEGLVKIDNCSCAQGVLKRLDNAFKDFFERIKKGIKAGHPRFKSWKRYRSIMFPMYGNGCKVLENGKLYLQGVGHIKVKWHRELKGKIKSTIIIRDVDRWYVCFAVEQDHPEPLLLNNRETCFDLGITSFLVMCDGTVIDNPRFLEHSQKKLRKAQRKLARCKRGSNRRKKAVINVAKIHRKIRNQRLGFHHKVSRFIVNQYGRIAHEDLNIQGLAKSKLAKQVNDVAWGQFLRLLAYKAENAGRLLMKVDPKGTSQECICGAKVPKTLKDRWHKCPECGFEGPRDWVSALITLKRVRMEPSWHNAEVVNSSVPREVV